MTDREAGVGWSKRPVSATSVHPRALIEGGIGPGTRVWAYTHVCPGAHVGRDCNLGEGVYVEAGARVGNGVVIKNGVQLWDGVELGDDVFVGPNVTFTNDRHPRAFHAGFELVPTIVRRGATIGGGATIVAGVTIGVFAFVAAGAVVTRSVGAGVLVAGVPARPIGFVCRCGRRLDDQLTCPTDRTRYDVRDGQIAQFAGL